ncbi:hypothetical protein BpHYR1_045724 [Brachionus plicatilis]|uniref:Uncharacterized protein n=1 Tax=Brachionus plicatilis TaxID=10195 RepID=A0A3M7PHG1_BRAPC|nr:hypothetical protein BpHYR1_045724 [Brachionus plicatilis]
MHLDLIKPTCESKLRFSSKVMPRNKGFFSNVFFIMFFYRKSLKNQLKLNRYDGHNCEERSSRDELYSLTMRVY